MSVVRSFPRCLATFLCVQLVAAGAATAASTAASDPAKSPPKPAVRSPAATIKPIVPPVDPPKVPTALPAVPVLPGVPDPPRTEVPARMPAKPAPSVQVSTDVAGKKSVAVPFAGDAGALAADAKPLLDQVASRLAAAPKERLELRAHAGRFGEDEGPARRLSLARAISVRDYLLSKGVGKERLIVFALGSQTSEGDPDRVDLVFR